MFSGSKKTEVATIAKPLCGTFHEVCDMMTVALTAWPYHWTSARPAQTNLRSCRTLFIPPSPLFFLFLHSFEFPPDIFSLQITSSTCELNTGECALRQTTDPENLLSNHFGKSYSCVWTPEGGDNFKLLLISSHLFKSILMTTACPILLWIYAQLTQKVTRY